MSRGKQIELLLRFPYYGPYDGSIGFPLRALAKWPAPGQVTALSIDGYVSPVR